MFKRTLLGALVAGTLSACGTLPGVTTLGSGDDATTAATRNFYSVMGLGDAVSAEDAATGDVSVPGQPPDREARMRARFARFDANGDGQVSYDEFLAAAPGPRQGVPDAGAVFDRIDDDASAGIGSDEFRAGCDRKGRPGPGEMKRGGKRGHGPGRGGRRGHHGANMGRPHQDGLEAPRPEPSASVPPAVEQPAPDAPANELSVLQG
ncbi:MAG: EF-hand domain-containing protein [Candidatus Sericytochromatia bacterium]|nr:EF-hand domain-containing protein [Candidatus Sericytochromatia bacterium]